MNTIKDKKLLFLFSRKVNDEFPRIKNKEIPSEILYGVTELTANGWRITVSDDRHLGLFGQFNQHIKPLGIHLINFSTIVKIYNNDITVVKGEFSLMTTITCRLLGKKIIYKDALFRMPRWFWMRWSAYLNLRLASAVIAYSDYQARTWEKAFNIQEGEIDSIDYSIDSSFYPSLEYKHDPASYVISVGRDLGRDYQCLARSLDIKPRKVELVTLPYLLSESIRKNNNITIHQRLSYHDLFNLYSKCLCSVVPLGKNLNYPTGIRGVLESLALGIPTIATYTPVLAEYFKDGEDLIFVEADNASALSAAITEIANNKELAYKLSINGKNTVRNKYNMQIYADKLEEILKQINKA